MMNLKDEEDRSQKASLTRLTSKGWYPASEVRMIMEGDLLHLRSGKDSFINRYVHLTLMSKILSHTSSGLSNTEPTDGLTAAFETKISKPPKSVLVCNFSQLYNFSNLSSLIIIRKIRTEMRITQRKYTIYIPYFFKQIFSVFCLSYMADSTSNLQTLGLEFLYSLLHIRFLTATNHYLSAFLR